LEKGFGGDDSPSVSLSKNEILDTMEDMMRKSMDSGRQGRAGCGEDINLATAKYEELNQISKAMYEEVLEHRKGQAH
jgi:hypothetical protein